MTFEGRRVGSPSVLSDVLGELLLAEDLPRASPHQLGTGTHHHRQRDRNRRNRRSLEVVGVRSGRRPLLRRVLDTGLAHASQGESIVDFSSIEPLRQPLPTARLRMPYRKLASCTPLRFADLVEQPVTKRARRSSKPWARTASSRPTFRRARHDPPVRVSLNRVVTPKPRGCCPIWNPTTPLTSSPRLTKSAACPSSSCCPANPQGKVRQLLSYNASTAGE